MKTKWSLLVALLLYSTTFAWGAKTHQNDLGRIVGEWDVWIPGAVSQVVSETRVYNTYQPGAAMNKLTIKSNGNYTWGEKNGTLKRVTPWYAEPSKSYFQVVDRKGNSYDFWYKSDTDQLILLFGEVGGHAASGTRLAGTEGQKEVTSDTAPETGIPIDESSLFKVGDAVEIDWSGMWYKGVIREVANGSFKVHYDGWSDTYDEWVGAGRLRKTKDSGQTGEKKQPAEKEKTDSSKDSSTFEKGQKVQINWSGTWYKGSILEVSNEKYKVRYDDWGSTYDEWVGPERLRKQ